MRTTRPRRFTRPATIVAALVTGLALTAGQISPASPASALENVDLTRSIGRWSVTSGKGSLYTGPGRAASKAQVFQNSRFANSVTVRAPRLTSSTVEGTTYLATLWVRASTPSLVRLRAVETLGSTRPGELVTTQRVGTSWTQIGISYTAKRSRSTLDLLLNGYRLAPSTRISIDELSMVTRSPQWADEFNGTELDRSSWNVPDNAAVGASDNEQSCYFDRPENVLVSDGALQLIGRREDQIWCGVQWPHSRAYSSGLVNTSQKRTFTNGFFEMRAKVPTAQENSQGLWSAFWLWPQDNGVGELDVMEAIGTSSARPNEYRQVHQFIHYDHVETYPQQGQAYVFPSGTPSDGYHTYAVDWTPTAMRWFVDGALTYTRDLTTTPWIKSTFTRPMHLILNLTVGATWPGTPNSATQLPATFSIDYVRVYR